MNNLYNYIEQNKENENIIFHNIHETEDYIYSYKDLYKLINKRIEEVKNKIMPNYFI